MTVGYRTSAMFGDGAGDKGGWRRHKEKRTEPKWGEGEGGKDGKWGEEQQRAN